MNFRNFWNVLSSIPWGLRLAVPVMLLSIQFNLWNGLYALSSWEFVATMLILTHVTIAAITIYLHRAMAHSALELHPVASHFFRFWLWMTTGMVTKEWTAIHRKHHAKCETADDPHSPQAWLARIENNFLRIFLIIFVWIPWRGVRSYVEESKNQETLERYGRGTPDDWLERHVYTPHSKLGIVMLLAIEFFLLGPVWGTLLWLIQMLWTPVLAAGVINGVGHFVGYRHADTTDASRNIFPFGLLIGGEEHHNNHHLDPSSAKLSRKWWEFDVGWLYIRLLQISRLATVKHVHPTSAKRVRSPDEKTLLLLRRDNGYVRKSLRKLMLSLIDQEIKESQGSAKRRLIFVRDALRHMSWRETHLLPGCNVMQRLPRQERLELIMRFAQLFMSIQAPAKMVVTSPEREARLLDDLRAWYRDAQQTKIKPLMKFADKLFRLERPISSATHSS